MPDDFGHRLTLDSLRDGERLDLAADPGEREAIAQRLGLAALDRLEAHAAVERDDQRIRVRGRIRAALEQSCVATGEPVPEHVDEAFELIFIPEPGADGAAEEEIELSEEDCDIVFYEGAAIDLGEAIADTLALSVDPYPRSPGAEIALKEAGVLTEEQAGPFAALAKLKEKRGS